MLPGRLWKTAGPAGSAVAAAAVGSFRGVKHSRGRTKESKAGGIILVYSGKDISRNLLYYRRTTYTQPVAKRVYKDHTTASAPLQPARHAS